MNKNKAKKTNRIKRHHRLRMRVYGTAKRPRISVFKSSKHIFVQFIDDASGKTLLSSKIVSGKKSKMKGTKIDKAETIGEMLAQKAKEAGIVEGVFDRGGFKYHGRIKALAEGLKKGGIKI